MSNKTLLKVKQEHKNVSENGLKVVLGDEAVALGAIDSGISSAYGYPGTPSTEIMEYLIHNAEKNKIFAAWSSNEKTAYEEALGASFAGKRVLVTMKHVGLNVAADPFINSGLLNIKGGLVLAVADDPGMHSSQNEQDSRFYADFAHIPCFEPVNQQEAYDMTREAFKISESYSIPVIIRLVTRLSHSRASIKTENKLPENKLEKDNNKSGWLLLPSISRKNYHLLLKKYEALKVYSEENNDLNINRAFKDFGVITTGLAKNYYLENYKELEHKPSHLHISFYPIPEDRIRELASNVDKIVILEEGYPITEKKIRGVLPQNITISGKLDGSVPFEGELNPDNVRKALGLKERKVNSVDFLPGRPPQLCKGCPHEDSFNFIKNTISVVDESIVTADIGCYALGALPPFSVPETIVCMGASITLAKGAAEAGHKNVSAVIGDSTFYHSGMTGLVDCVSYNTPITIVILDNDTVGMTGGQPTILPSSKLEGVVKGLGVDPEHVKVLNAHRKDAEKNEQIFKQELEYQGVSVIIAVRECIEWLRKQKKRGNK